MAESDNDLNTVDEFGNTALHRAAEHGSVQRIHELLRVGADTEVRDKDGATPLLIASRNEENEAVDRLLEGGANVHARDAKGNTALHFAADTHNADLTALLLESGADPNSHNDIRQTPLHSTTDYASQVGRSSSAIETMDLLLHSGADINAQDRDGNTALHFVAEGRTPESDRVAEAILQKGADSTIADNKGLNALDIANEDRESPAAGYSSRVKDAIIQYRQRTESQGHETPMPAEPEHDPNALPSPVQFRDEVDLDPRGMSPLHEATLDDSVLQINEALEAGHDLEARDREGATPLHWASASMSHQALERLIEAGADLGARDDQNRTPLHWAARYGSPEAVDRLLEAEADLNARDERGDTALHKAAAGISPEAVERLLDAKADPNARNYEQETPLHKAHFALAPDTVDRLLKAGADPQALDVDGDTPLHRATAARANRSMELLLEAKADPNARDRDGDTPLHRAARMNYPECVERLLKAGAAIDVHDNEYKLTPLHQAAAYGALDAADRLLEAGANPNARSVNGDTPLHRVIDSGWSASGSDMVKRLIEGGADLDPVESQYGRTPLNLAADFNNPVAVETLLKAGANPHIQDHEGHTALHTAARKGFPETVDRLLEGGADPHIHGVNRGDTALIEAASHGSTESVERLLKAGADPDARDNDGASALHHAARAGSAPALDRLLKDDYAYHQAADSQGRTPLHVAAQAGESKCVDRLLKAGAQMHVHDNHGRTPLDLAREADRQAAAARLERAAAERQSPSRVQRFFNRFRNRYKPPEKDISPEGEHGHKEMEASNALPADYIDKKMQEYYQQQQRHKENPMPGEDKAPGSESAAQKPSVEGQTDKTDTTEKSRDPQSHSKEKVMPQEHWSNSKSARKFEKEVATRYAGQIDKGKASLQKGYDKPRGNDVQPFNPATLKRFKGLNAIQLKSVAQEKGYDDPRWMSFQAANRVGAKIRKGERGARVEYLRYPPKSQASQGKDSPEAAGGERKEQPRISHHTYVVFNAKQIERMPALEQQLAAEPQQHEICARAERLIRDSGVNLESPPKGQDHAHYDKDRDTVVIAPRDNFKSDEAYYSQAVKELAGRAGHELQKDRPEPRGEAQQAAAEARHDMRREMAADTICSKLHLPKEPTGEYCKKQWAETIRNNPSELRHAARDADRMADKVLEHDRPQQRSQAEPSRSSSVAEITPGRVQQIQQPQHEMAAEHSR